MNKALPPYNYHVAASNFCRPLSETAMRRSIFSGVVSVLGIVRSFHPAQADEYRQVVGVQCSGNGATIRFGWSNNEDPVRFNPLPSGFDRWLDVPIAQTGHCRLSNGQEVVARAGTDQPFAYGMGGDNPPEFFSLWIGGKKIVSRQIYKDGGASPKLFLSAVFVGTGSITSCRYDVKGKDDLAVMPPAIWYEAKRAADVPTRCETRKLDVSMLRADPKEAPAERATVGTISVADGDRTFCRQFIRPTAEYRAISAASYFNIGAPSTVSKEVLAFLQLHPDVPFADDGVGPGTSIMVEGGMYAVAQFDLFGDGHPAIVIRFSGDNHYFDGERFFIREGQVDHKDIAALIAANFEPDDAKGWRIIDGGATLYERKYHNSARYTHFALFRLGGKTYLLARPTNQELTPSAILYRVDRSGLSTTCTFQMNDENY